MTKEEILKGMHDKMLKSGHDGYTRWEEQKDQPEIPFMMDAMEEWSKQECLGLLAWLTTSDFTINDPKSKYYILSKKTGKHFSPYELYQLFLQSKQQ
jgi:hypothetical protein